MKKLILRLAGFMLFFAIFFEVFLRLTGLATDIPQMKLYDNGYVLPLPNSTWDYTRGGRSEISTPIQTNSQGWTSTIEYNEIDSCTIALIGDSFIEGWQVSGDINHSIGRQVEQMTNHKIKVHEYGKSGANIQDYQNLYSDLKGKGYKCMFILINLSDISEEDASFTKKEKHQKNHLIDLLNEVAIIRYLKTNLFIFAAFTKKAAHKTGKVQNTTYLEGMMQQIKEAKGNGTDVLYLYEDSIFQSLNQKYDMVEIDHKIQPYHHGFSTHWNMNGAQNVATTIVAELKARGFEGCK